MIFYDYLLIPQLFSYTAISQRNTVSCIKYQHRSALIWHNFGLNHMYLATFTMTTNCIKMLKIISYPTWFLAWAYWYTSTLNSFFANVLEV